MLKQTIIWREILECVFVVQTLAQQNLTFRVHKKSNIDEDNCIQGDSLTLLKYLDKFDPVLGNNLQSVSENPGSSETIISLISNTK